MKREPPCAPWRRGEPLPRPRAARPWDWVPILALAAALLAPALVATVPAGFEGASSAPARRVIVELAGEPALAALPRGAPPGPGGPGPQASLRALAGYRASLRGRQELFLARLRAAGLAARPRDAFTLLANGLALEVPAGEVARLARLPGVAAVVPDAPVRASAGASVPLVGAPELWARRDPRGLKVRGAGVTVAVVDTGVDYTHPALGGGFGPGHKVVAGYDFVNDDPDPMDDNGHGTHVAGIVAAAGQGEGAVVGVAPEATLTAYKVLAADGTGWASDIIKALEEAVDPANPYRADVVNLSLGGAGDGSDPLGRAAALAARAGTVVVAAAGNSGPGVGTVTTPAAADGVIAVGASTSELWLPTARLAAPERRRIQAGRMPFSANPPAEPLEAELVDVGAGDAEGYGQQDVRGKAVLIRAAEPQDGLRQAVDAERRGAVAAFFYRPELPPPPEGLEREPPWPARRDQLPPGSGGEGRLDRLVALHIDGTEHAALARHLAAGPVRVVVEGRDATDELADFSSRGPGGRYQAKPELVAPGVEVRSTVPRALFPSGVYRMSGTSMAAPHVAGGAALLRQLFPQRSAEDLRAMLVGAARPLPPGGFADEGVGEPRRSGPGAQGAGRLDLPAAAAAAVTASPPTLSLGLADLRGPELTASGSVTLHNHGKAAVALRLRAEPAGAAGGAARVEPAELALAPGASATVRVRLAGGLPEEDGELAGWVVVDAPEEAGASDLRVPYLLAARLLRVRALPDPGTGDPEVLVQSEAALGAAPVLTVTGPDGRATRWTARPDPERPGWWRVRVRAGQPGTWRVAARAPAAPALRGVTLTGAQAFEVLAADQHAPGARGWEPVGPNAEAGTLTTAAGGRRVLVDSQGGGLWITADRGRTWRRATRLPVAGGTGTALAVDPSDPRRLWWALRGGDLDPSYQGRILRSEDGGQTWSALDFPDVEVTHLAAGGRGPTLVAVTRDALYRSHDRGDTWEPWGVPWTGGASGALLLGEDLYVATLEGLWVVPGIAGEPSAPPQPAARRFSPPGGWLLGVEGDGELLVAWDLETLYASADGGVTWKELFTAPPGEVIATVDAEGGDLYVSGFETFWVGRDRGAAWEEWPEPVPGADEVGVASWPLPAGGREVLVAALGAGLFATADGGRSYRRVGVQAVTVHDLAVAEGREGGLVLVAATGADTYRTALPAGPAGPGVAEWGRSGGEGRQGVVARQVATDPRDPRVVWKVRAEAGGFFGVYRSDDGGAGWRRVAYSGGVPGGLLVHPADPRRVYVGFWSAEGAGLYASLDGGRTWRKRFHGRGWRALAGDPRDRDRLWLGGDGGLWRSGDGGETVRKVLDGPVRAISVDPRVPDRVVVGGERLRVSGDGGRTFREARAGGVPMMVSDVVTAPTDPQVLFASTTSYRRMGVPAGGRGVLRSTDGGFTWENISLGLEGTAVASLVPSPDGAWLYAGTVGGGVYRLRLAGPPGTPPVTCATLDGGQDRGGCRAGRAPGR